MAILSSNSVSTDSLDPAAGFRTGGIANIMPMQWEVTGLATTFIIFVRFLSSIIQAANFRGPDLDTVRLRRSRVDKSHR